MRNLEQITAAGVVSSILAQELQVDPGDFQSRSFPVIPNPVLSPQQSKMGVEIILGANDPNTSKGRLRFAAGTGWEIPNLAANDSSTIGGKWQHVSLSGAVSYAKPFIEEAQAYGKGQVRLMEEAEQATQAAIGHANEIYHASQQATAASFEVPLLVSAEAVS